MIDDGITQQLRCAQAKLESGDFDNVIRICQTVLDSSPSCLPALLEASGLINFGSPECKILRVAAIQVDRLAKTGSAI